VGTADRGKGPGGPPVRGAASNPKPSGSDAATNTGASDAAFLPEPGPHFVSTPFIEHLVQRASIYLEVGYPVHFAGFAGTGKTTIALHVAARRGRPAILMHGDAEYAGSDLVGREGGYAKSKTVDNFVRSVVRSEEKVRVNWNESALTTACREGYTFIYDEFNRSRPEANNVLLSVLEEGILSLPALHEKRGFIQVHPEFRAIFTSNPEEYGGTHQSADALLDRMITMNLNQYDHDTEIDIAAARGLPRPEAEIVVDIVRAMRSLDPNRRHPSLRAALAIANITARRGAHARADDEFFRWVCRDIINMTVGTGASVSQHSDKLEEAIDRICAGEKVDWSNSPKTPGQVEEGGNHNGMLTQLRKELSELQSRV
jgi:nitric oxide reductase NorQ protein